MKKETIGIGIKGNEITKKEFVIYSLLCIASGMMLATIFFNLIF